jgi:hypothetical protein
MTGAARKDPPAAGCRHGSTGDRREVFTMGFVLELQGMSDPAPSAALAISSASVLFCTRNCPSTASYVRC